MTDDQRVEPAHEVVVVAVDRFQLLDLAGPVEVLRTATLLGATPGYRTVVATPDGGPVRSESGVGISADASVRSLARGSGPIGTLLVVGGAGARESIGDRRLIADIRKLAVRSTRVASVCTGAYLLAAAGLLDGRRATTHWAHCDDLAARYPEVDMLGDRIYVRDGEVWTAAGVTAGIDLALALVEADHSPELAHNAAGWLVVFVRRPGGQAQFSAQLLAGAARSPGVAEVQQWIPDHLDDDLTVAALAARAGMSQRNFARAFRAETGATPAAFVETMRVEAARRLLETTDRTVAAIATAVGLRHAETLHRSFRRRLGTTPDQYRAHFKRAS